MALSKEAQERIKKLRGQLQDGSLRNSSNGGSSSKSTRSSESGSAGTTKVGTTLSSAALKRIDGLKDQLRDGSLRYSSQIVDDEYIDSFITDARDFTTKYGSAYDSLDYKTATGDSYGSYYDTLRETESDLKQRAYWIKDYMSTRKGQYDEDTYKDFSDYLDSFSNLSVAQAFNDKSKYYSQFETEDAYNAFEAYYPKYNGQSYDAIQKALSTLEDGSEEKNWLSAYQYELYDGDSNYTSKATSGMKSYEAQKIAEQEAEKNKPWYEKVIENFTTADTSLPAATLSNVQAAYRNDTSYKEPNENWSDSQRRHHGYLWAEDPKKAEAYAEQVNNQINALAKYEQQQKVQGSATKNFWSGAGHTAGAIATAPLALADYLDDLAEFSARGTITQKNIITPFEYSQAVQSGITNHLNDKYGTIDEDVWMLGGKGLGDLYNWGVSEANSRLSALALGPYGTLVNFMGQAGAAGVDNLLSRGATPEQALLYGTIVGGAEGALEALGADNLLKVGSSATLTNYLRRNANQGIGELFEEFGSSTIEKIADRIIMKDKSNFKTAVKSYMDDGMDEKDAKNKAWLDMVGEVTFDAISGYASGSTGAAVFGGYNTMMDARKGNQANIKALEQYGEHTDALIEEGLQSDVKSESYKLAKKYQQQVEGTEKKAGKDLTGFQIRNLVAANEAQFAVEDFDTAVTTAKERLTELGETNDVSKVAKLVAKRVSGQELTRAEKSILARSQYGAQVAKEMTTPTEETKSGTKAYNIKYKSITERVGEESRYGVSESGQTTLRNENEAIAIAEVSDVKDGQLTVKLTDGREVYAGDIDFANESESFLYSAIADMENITPASATALVKNYDPASEQTVGEYVNGIDEAYTYGYHGYSEADLKAGQYVTNLSNEQMMSAYKLGQSARAIGIEAQDAPAVQMRTAAEAKLTKNQQHVQLKTQFASDDVEVYFEDGANVVKFDEHNAGQYDEKRMAGVNAAKFLSKMGLGGKYFFYESYENAEGNRVYKDANGNEVNAPNGIYKSSDGSIHIDMNAGDNGDGTTLYTLGHESTHFVKQHSAKQFKVLSDLVTEAYSKTDMTMHERVVEKQNRLSEIRGEHVSYDEAHEEVVADAMSTMFSDGNIYEKLAELKTKDRGLFNTIKKFFENLIAKFKEIYASLTPDQKDAQDIREMKAMFDRIQDAFAKALVEASDNFRAAMESVVEAKSEPISTDEIITDGAVVTDGDGEKHSIRSMKHDIAEGKMFEDLKTYCNWTNAQVTELRKQLNALVEYMIPYRDILDMNESYGREGRRFSPYKPNSDPLYKISMDFSTLCSKRLLTQYVIENLQLREGRPMSAEEQMAIRDMLNEYRKVEKGLQVACAMCYVEAARLKSPKQIQRWLDDPAPHLINYFAQKNSEFNASVKNAQADFKESKGYDRNAPKKDMKPADVKELNKIGPRLRSQYQLSAEEQAIVERAKSLPNETYLTAGNLANLCGSETEADRVIYKAYTDFVRTATRSKSLESDEPYYYGDSRRDNGNGIIVSDSFIEAVNRENGMRFSSWSDWRIQHMLDYITAVIDNSVRGAAMHGYTKFPDEVRVLGKTGMMFNMSGVAGTQTGLNEDGSLSFSETESINFEEAKALRKEFPETAGLQCIGVGDEHIRKLLRSDIIDYVIPYHVSGLNAALRRMADIHGWKDYTSTQHAAIDKSIKFEDSADQEHWHEEPVYSEFFVGYDTGMNGIEAMRASAEKYKQLCKDRGLKPKFEQFATEDNYWKLLIDRKMVNQETGKLIQQRAVTPTFDFDAIKRVVDLHVQNYDAGLEKRALNHIVENWDSIPNRIKDLKKGNKTKKSVDTLANQTVAAQPKATGEKRSDRYGGIREVLAKRGLDELSKKFGSSFPLSASFDATMRADSTPLVMETVQANQVKRKPKESAFKAGKQAFARTYGAKTTVHIKQMGIDAELFPSVAGESISKALGRPDEQSTLDVIPHISDILSNSIFMGIERIAHTDNKGTALYGYRLYNLYWYQNGNKKTPNCLVCTVVQDLDKAEGYVFQNIENVTVGHGLPGNNTGMPKPSSGNTYNVSQLYQTVKKIDRSNGGLKYTDAERDKYLFTYTERNDGVKYSERTNAPVFYSQMGKVVEGMKQEKFGASSVISMLRGRGVKAEEIRWSGIQAFLEGKKSVTKAELLDFINSSMLQIEETMLDGTRAEHAKLPDNYRLEETTDDFGDPLLNLYIDGERRDTFRLAADDSIESAGDSNIWAMNEADLVGQILNHYAGMSYDEAYLNESNGPKWGDYKLDGGENYRELVFKMPNSTYTNRAMRGHWGEDAQGVLAHARMQDFDVNGKRMLFIEEIQSDWHNEGHRSGYGELMPDEERKRIKNDILKKFVDSNVGKDIVNKTMRYWGLRTEAEAHEMIADDPANVGAELIAMYPYWMTEERTEAIINLQQQFDKLDRKKAADAPFKDNYHEYVLKRLLRMAAEEGYDSIGWTTADIQSQRWSEEYAEGYRIEYDQDIPKFLKKYGKQWGAEVGKTPLPGLDAGETYYDVNREESFATFAEWKNTVLARLKSEGVKARDVVFEKEHGSGDFIAYDDHTGTEYDRAKVIKRSDSVWSMDITPAMKKSVLDEGQAMYSERTGDSVSNRSLLANAFEFLVQNSEEYKLVQEYRGHIKELNKLDAKLSDLNAEIREIRFGTEGRRDADRLYQLETEAKEVAKEINRHDKRLLSLEATEPLRKVIERERKKEAQKTKDHVKEIQQNKKVRAEQAELRHKIRKTIRDLDKILNRGNKKLNVKEDMKGFATKALELADYLFTDHISNDELIRNGITVRMTPKEAALVKETEDILTKLYDHADSLTDEEFTRLDERRKINETKLRDLLTAQRNERLNTSVYNLFNDLVTEYASLKNSKQDAVRAAYNADLERLLRQFMGDTTDGTDSDRKKLLQNMRVADMTTAELNKLYEAYKMVLTNVRDANKVFVMSKYESIDKMADAITWDFSSRKIPEGKVAIVARNLSNKMGWDYEKLYYALDRIGSEAFTELVMNIANSENIVMQDVMEAAAFRDEMVKKYGYNNWKVNKEIDREFLDSTGKKFNLTLGQLMALYAYSRREGAWDHIEYGGFVFGEAALTNPRPADSYKMSKAQCEAITSLLTKEQKAYAEDMQKYLSETMGEKGNEVSMLLYGIKMFGEKNYFPIHIAGQFKAQANESQAKAAAGFSSMSNAGFTHAQNPNAKAPFVLEGFNEIWVDHVNEMSRYHGTVPALEDMRRVMNRSSYSESGADSMAIKQLMENSFGKEAVEYFDNLYREANSGAITDKLQKRSKKLLSLFRKNSVAYSLSVIIQQPSAMVRAYAMIPKKYFGFKGFGALSSGIAKAVTSKWTKAHTNAYNEMLKYAPGVTMAKEIGGFDTATGGSIRSYLLDTNKSFVQSMKTENVKGKAKAVLGLVDDNAIANLPNVADKIAWIEIWNACKRETVSKHKDLTPGSEEFMQAVGKRFTEVIRATQVYDSIFAKSPMLKSQNLAVQYLVSFMNEPNTTANMVEKAVRDATKGNWKGGVRVAAAVTASIIFNNVLKSIVYAMRDDDEDETYIEKYLEAVAGNLVSDFNALNYIPVARDVWSLAQGYDVERADMAIVADAIDAISKVVKNATKDTEDMTEDQLMEFDKKCTEANWKLVESLATFFGIPLKNIHREIEGVINTVRNTAANHGLTTKQSVLDKVYESVVGSIPFMQASKSKDEKLYDAIMGGDQTYLGRIKSTYKTDNAYESAVRKVLRENDPRIQEAAAAKASGNTAEYNRIIKEIIGDNHFDSKTVEMAISSEVAAMTADLRENDQRIKEAAIAWNANDLDEYMRIAKEIISEKLFSQDNVVTAIRSVADSLLPDDGTTSSSKEDSLFTAEKFAVAIAQGDQATARAAKEDIILTAQKNGKTAEEAEKNFIKSSKTQLKEQFLAGTLAESKAINALTAYCDETLEDADKLIGEWAFEKQYGFTYEDRGDAYKSGAISAYELQDILINVGGKTEEEAVWQVKVYDWQSEGFDIDSNQKTVVEDYETYCEPAGIDKRTYFDAYLFYADAGEEGVKYSKTIECMPYINSLPLTPAQKTNLALCWWAESTVRKYKTW